MTVEESSFSIGDAVKIKDSAWDVNFDILVRFGFEKSTSYEVSGVYPGRGISLVGNTSIYYPHYFELSKSNTVYAKYDETKTVPVKSDGGSSSYYELTITNKAGESIKCETGDVIRALVGNDFDFGNCVKALRRMYLATLGMGKEGTDIPYDCNKVRYFLSEIERVNK